MFVSCLLTSPVPSSVTDHPESNPDRDSFGRHAFARRLATRRRLPAPRASLVVGLYGKWGEGKSTVLYFVEHELRAVTPPPVILHLNPWRFPQEDQLLLDFFQQLAASLGQHLKSKGEKFAQAVTRYAAPLLPTFSLGVASTDPGKSLQAIGEVAQPSLEELQQRVNQFIVDAKRRVIVLVDDVDRLEKQQVQAVFRLVKLTANFSNTAYLLAFYEEMVARALGEVFSTSPDAQADGRSFLEKIIQFPLRLPRARPDDLLAFCLARVREVLQENNLPLDPAAPQLLGQLQADRFAQAFRQGVMPRLTTPRVAIRYANAIRFSLPLLLGEVSPIDLLLVEALNCFYPEVYRYVAAHQDLFTSQNLRILRDLGGGADSNAELEGALGSLFADHHYSRESQVAVRGLLRVLFPKLVILTTGWPALAGSEQVADDAALERSSAIASPRYFSRYFSYSVASDDVTDHEFTAFLQADGGSQPAHFRALATKLGLLSTLTRLAYWVPELPADQCRTLFTSLLQAADLYSSPRNWEEAASGEMAQAIQLLVHLLARVPGAPEQAALAAQFSAAPGSFEFACWVHHRLRQQVAQSPSLWQPVLPTLALAAADWEQLVVATAHSLLLRALREASSLATPLYRSHPLWARELLLTSWPALSDVPPGGPVAYMLPYLQRQPATEVTAFLTACGDVASGKATPFYLTSLSLQTFDHLRSLFGQPLYELVRSQYGPEAVGEADVVQQPAEPTPRQRLQQFIWLWENRPLPAASAIEESQ